MKGVNFVGLRDVGDPVQLGGAYSDAGADELGWVGLFVGVGVGAWLGCGVGLTPGAARPALPFHENATYQPSGIRNPPAPVVE